MPVVNLQHAFQKAIPNWDPAKHPRDRDGQFIETGDFVRAYENALATEPVVVGRVVASYFAPDGRMFIGVDNTFGYVQWFRPKQLEHVAVKATLGKKKDYTPSLPLPSVDAQYDEVFWDDPNNVFGNHAAIPDGEPGTITAKDLDDEFKELIGLEKAATPSVVPQDDEPKLPAGKTPEDMLRMIGTSFENKYNKNTGIIYPGGVAGFKLHLDQAIDEPDFDKASAQLKALMKHAKLGGKQVKRYNAFLSMKHNATDMAITKVTLPTDQEAVKSTEPANGSELAEWELELLEQVQNGALDEPDPGGETKADDIWPDVSAEDYVLFEAHLEEEGGPYYVTKAYQALIAENSHQGAQAAQQALFAAYLDDTKGVTKYHLAAVNIGLAPSGEPFQLEHYEDAFPEAEADGVASFLRLIGSGDPDKLKFVVTDAKGGAEASATARDSALKALWLAYDQFGEVGNGDLAEAGITVTPNGPVTPHNKPKPAGNASGLTDAQVKKVESHSAKVPLGDMEIFKHPQGAIIIADPLMNTVIKVKPDGTVSSTSATIDKLQAGHGAWKSIGTGSDAIAPAASEVNPNPPGSGLPTPSVPKAPTELPTVDESQNEVLQLLGTTIQNKGVGYPGWASDLAYVTSTTSYEGALPILNKLMTAAKLGGKQRKRYKDALAAKFGAGPMVIEKKGKGPSSWAAIEPANPGVNTAPGVTGPTKGNQLVNPNGLSPQGAKGSIQTQIANRLRGKVTVQEVAAAFTDSEYKFATSIKHLGQMAELHAHKGGPPGGALTKQSTGYWMFTATSSAVAKGPGPTKEQWETALLENIANSLIQQWAGTSNDTNARALAMQDLAVEEFGLTSTYDWHTNPALKADTEKEKNKHRKLYRAFLRAQYENTQEWAKANGVKRVRLRRGSGTYAGPVGSSADVKLRPMSSFSTNLPTAQNFGSHRIEAYVPIEWVIGTAASGYGCQSEYEWVVLGGVHKVRVIS